MKISSSTLGGHIRGLVLLATLLALLPACDAATEPEIEFDPRQQAASLDSIVNALEASEDIFDSFQLTGDALDDGEGDVWAGAALDLVWVSIVPGAAASAHSPDGEADRLLRSANRIEPLAVVPEQHLGKTFVWQPSQSRYGWDESRDGAPSDGVRFVLYEMHSQTRRPREPLTEIGYFDIIDETPAGSEASARVRVRAAETPSGEDPVTRVDYVIDITVSETASGARVDQSAGGFVIGANGARIDFDIDRTLHLSRWDTAIDIEATYGFERTERDIAMELTLDGLLSSGGAALDLDMSMNVRRGSDEGRLELEIAPTGGLAGSLTHDGRTLIIIMGTTTTPHFREPGGGEPNFQVRTAMRRMYFGSRRASLAANRLLSPFQDVGA